MLVRAWENVTEWQRAQFPEGTLAGAAAHLKKEGGEVDDAVPLEQGRDAILEEAADCFFMLARLCDLLGCTPREFADYVAYKLAKNRGRSWPSKPNAEGVYGHLTVAA